MFCKSVEVIENGYTWRGSVCISKCFITRAKSSPRMEPRENPTAEWEAIICMNQLLYHICYQDDHVLHWTKLVFCGQNFDGLVGSRAFWLYCMANTAHRCWWVLRLFSFHPWGFGWDQRFLCRRRYRSSSRRRRRRRACLFWFILDLRSRRLNPCRFHLQIQPGTPLCASVNILRRDRRGHFRKG